MQQRSPLITAFLIFAAFSAAANLSLGILCFALLVWRNWLGLVLAISLVLPACAWALSFRSLLLASKAFAVAFLAIWVAWTVNDLITYAPSQRTISSLLAVGLPNLGALSTLSLLLSSLLLFAAYSLQSRPGPQQLSSMQGN